MFLSRTVNKIFQVRRTQIFGTTPNKFPLLVHRGSRSFWYNAVNPYRANHSDEDLWPGAFPWFQTNCRLLHDQTNNKNNKTIGKKRRGSSESKSRSKASVIERNEKIDSMGKSSDWKGILELYQNESKEYNNVNLATTMSRLGRIKSFDKHDPVFLGFVDDLAAIIEENGIRWIGVRQLANIVHAIGKMKLSSSCARKILDMVARKENVPFLFENTRSVANIAWTFGSVGFQAPNLFSAINHHGTWLVDKGNTQDVSNTAWACAALGAEAPNFFSSINNCGSWLVTEGNTQEVSNTAWACATLGVKAPNLFSAINDSASWLVEEGNTQNVANTAWACATLGVTAPNLFSSINDNASWIVLEGNAQDAANTAWACATLGVEAPTLFSAINNTANRINKEGTPQAIANIAWSFATLGYDATNFFEEIEKHVNRLVPEDSETNDETSQTLSNTAIAFAKLGKSSKIFFGFLCKFIPILKTVDDTQAITNIFYSFVTLGIVNEHHDEFLQLWDHAVSLDQKSFSDESFKQLYMAFFYISVTGIELEKPPAIPQDRELKQENQESRSQKDVLMHLEELGFDFEMEVCPLKPEMRFAGIPDNFLAIDIACRDRMIAVEFDGPTHFLIELGTDKELGIENGPTKAKRRFLERLGWTVINIPYFEWYSASDNGEGRSYLTKKLKKGGIPV